MTTARPRSTARSFFSRFSRRRIARRAGFFLFEEVMSIYGDFPRGAPGAPSRNALLATASWRSDLPLWEEGAIWLGRDDQGRDIGYRDDRHVVTIAGSRAGKGRSAITPNALLWPGSGFFLDPKGESATLTAARRAERKGHIVAVLDPKRVSKVPEHLRVSFNPLDLIDADSDDALDLAAAISDAVMIGSGDGKDIHWTESGRQLLEGLVLHVATSETGKRRSLTRVRRLLTVGDPEFAEMLGEDADGEPIGPFAALWRSMSSSLASNDAVRDVIVGAANSVMEMGDNERGSVLSTARRNTKFLDSAWVRRCFEGDGGPALDIDALKTALRGMSLYVCLPARFISTHSRILRLMLNLILYRMEEHGLDQPACGYPVLFFLDEFAALGRMEAIEKAAGLMAGFGVKLWAVLQDLGQLKRHYRESWETFMANAGILQFFANADLTTLEWISKRLGQVEVIRETAGRSESASTQISKSQGRTETSGWSRSNGQSLGQSEMPGLSQVAARDGGSGLVPFLARSNASGVGQNASTSLQEGQTGGESVQQGDSSSSGSSQSETTTESIHLAALLNPDEIARLFDRTRQRQLVFIDNEPVILSRLNWDDISFRY